MGNWALTSKTRGLQFLKYSQTSSTVNKAAAAAAAKSLQSCPTLCDPIYGNPQGSAAPGILQARTLEWVAISFSIVCCSVMSNSSQPHGLQPTRLLHPWDFPGKRTEARRIQSLCWLHKTEFYGSPRYLYTGLNTQFVGPSKNEIQSPLFKMQERKYSVRY